MGETVTVNDGNFEEIVLKADQPFLVDFWAPWCAPCRAVAPVVEELAEEYKGRIGFAKVNVDENSHIATEYGIRSIPTLLFFKDGKPMKQLIGFTPKEQMKENLDSLLGD
jgi:thioredoxin 1